MRKNHLIMVIFLFACYPVQGQIRHISIVDHFSKPLEDNDDGLRFEYQTMLAGELSAYFVYGDNNFIRLFANQKEFRGTGYINLPRTMINQFCQTGLGQRYNGYLELGLVTTRSSKFSRRRLPLTLAVNAPYGCQLEPLLKLPPKPRLYPPNVKKRVVRGEALIPVGLGIALTARSIIDGIKNAETVDGETHISLDSKFYLGILIAAVGSAWLHKLVPNKEKSNRNRELNRQLLQNWEWELADTKRKNQTIKDKNERIKDTFTVKLETRK